MFPSAGTETPQKNLRTELNKITSTTYSAQGLRTIIMQKQQAVKSRYGRGSGAIVLIKPTTASYYANIVNTLDEMQICGIKTYVLMEATPTELNKMSE